MQFGITYSIQSLTGEWTEICRTVLDQVELADEVGFHYALVSEHHLVEDNGYFPAPLTVLAAFAARTTRIRLATGILLLPLYQPMTVAEAAAVVDNLSDGRLTLGFGLGYRPEEFAVFHVPIEERAGRMEESLKLLHLLLSERKIDFDGDFFPMQEVTLMPRAGSAAEASLLGRGQGVQSHPPGGASLGWLVYRPGHGVRRHRETGARLPGRLVGSRQSAYRARHHPAQGSLCG